MTVDETKLDVVAKTKKNQKKNRLSPRTLRRARVKVKPNRQSHEIHPLFIHLSIHPERSPEPEPEEPEPEPSALFGCVLTLSQIHGSRPAKKKQRIDPRSQSRAAAPVQSARGFSHPSNHPLMRPTRPMRPTHANADDETRCIENISIDPSTRADARTDQRAVRSRASAHTRSTTRPTDGTMDGWLDDDPRYIPFSCTNRPFVNRQISHGSGPQDRRKHQHHHPAVRACRHIHPTIQHTHPDDATRRDANTTTYLSMFFSFVILMFVSA